MYQRALSFFVITMVAGVLGSGSAPMITGRTAPGTQLAASVSAKGVSFAADPRAYGGGDEGMDNLYTLSNYICTDGIAVNVAYQELGDVGNGGHEAHSLQMADIRDYGTPSSPNSSPTQVSITEGTYPYTLFTSPSTDSGSDSGVGSPATNSDGTWTGDTQIVHYASQPAGEEIVASIWRLDHGAPGTLGVLNEDDDRGVANFPNSNGDDAGNIGGWEATDDGQNGAAPGGDPSHDFAPNTDGSSFDDVLQTDQEPSSGNPSDPNSTPSFNVQPDPSTSLVQDCVVDPAPPQTTATYPAPDQNGWYREAVPVTLAAHKVYYLGGNVTTYYAVDGGSSQPGNSVSVQGDGTHTLDYHSEDSLSPTPDVESTQSLTFKIDGTAPTVAFDAGTCPTTVILGSSPPPATWTASDNTNGSGVATASTGSIPLDTSTVGPHTVTAPAPTDVAGNTGTSVPCNYTVIYNFKGFFQPVDNPTTVNTAKAGSTIPVKFSLTGNQGLNVFSTGSPGSQGVQCSALSTATSAIDQTTTAGNSSLSYDAGADQYTYNWKTDPSWKGTCRVLTVTLADTTKHQANFSFNK